MVAAYEGADGNGLVERAVQPDEADAPSVGTPVVRLDFADELHGAHFRRTAQCSGGEGVDEGADGIGVFQRSAHPAHEVDDVAIILRLFVESHVRAGAVPVQVVPGEVDQHHVFGVLFRVGKEGFGQLPVGLLVSASSGGARNGVDSGLPAFYLAMRFGRRAEDAESAEVEIEEVRRGVDAPQGTVEFEVIALEPLDEPAREDDLEHVSPQASGDSFADVRLVLLVGQGAGGLAYGVETVRGIVAVVDGAFYFGNVARLFSASHFHQYHFALEIVENDDVLIQDVKDIGRIVLRLGAVFHFDRFEIAHGIERCVSVKPAISGILSRYVETRKEPVHHLLYAACIGYLDFLARMVGIEQGSYPVAHADAGYRVQPDERAVVLRPVIVGTFHQGALRKQVAHLQVSAYRGMEVAQ